MTQKIKILKDIFKKPQMISIFKWLKIIMILGFYMFFISHKQYYNYKVDGVYKYNIMLIVAITSITGVLIVILLWNNKLSKKINKIISILYMIASPIYTFVIMEYIIKTNIYSLAPKKYIIFNIFILSILLLIFLAITNSLKWGSILTVSIGVIFSITNSFIYEFRGIPIMASDLTTLGTAAAVASNYTLNWTFLRYFGVFSIFAYWICGMKLKETKMFKWKLRTAFSVLTVVCVVLFIKVFIGNQFLEKQNMDYKMFKPMVTYQTYGSMNTFVKSIDYAVIEKPEGYSVDAVNDIINKYKTDKTTSTNTVKPNIISIINETFSDISVLGNVKTDKDYMPFFNSLKENTIKGTTYASIIGGQTANTEFEFLTNNSMAFLPEQSVVFQMYLKNNISSLASSLENLGYIGNIAMHMHQAENYNREKVYPLLDFKGFMNKDNYQDFTNAKISRVRKYPTDLCTYEIMEDIYETERLKSQNPFFMYNMTIQNHSPYDTDYDNFKKTIKLSKSCYNSEAERYLNLIKYSDDAFKQIVEYYEKVKEPTIIIMFGDHQPRLADSFLAKITDNKYKKWTDEEMMKRYAVPFVIWANYDIEEQTIEKTSMNYLQSIMLDAAGLELTGYQQFLLKLRESVPAINVAGYFGKDGKYYNKKDKTSPFYELIHEYSILEYNNMVDIKNRVDSFFYLQ